MITTNPRVRSLGLALIAVALVVAVALFIWPRLVDTSESPTPLPSASGSGAWSTVAPLPSVPTSRIADTVFVEPNTILVFLEGDSNLPILAYDTVADAWSQRTDDGLPLGGIGTDDALVLGTDGSVYRTSGGTETLVFRYKPQGNVWDQSQLALLPDVWASDGVALDDGTILLIGGGSTETSLVWFDPASRSAQRSATVPGNYRSAGGPLDGTILLFGVSGVARFDLSSGSWLAFDVPPPADLFDAGMGLGPDGRVYAIGGTSSGAPIATAFDPVHGRWLSVPVPSVARIQPEVVAGPDGLLYLIGGSVLYPSPQVGSYLELSVEVLGPAD